jgi:hypothetical protein
MPVHVHLDHDSCMEIAVLRGAMCDVRQFARHVVSERGVRHGRLVVALADTLMMLLRRLDPALLGPPPLAAKFT